MCLGEVEVEQRGWVVGLEGVRVSVAEAKAREVPEADQVWFYWLFHRFCFTLRKMRNEMKMKNVLLSEATLGFE